MNRFTSVDNVIISVKEVSKKYRLYSNPKDRLKEIFHPFSKKYHKEFWALQDVSLTVKKGETVGIIGQNGSGKSTLLQAICGLLKPTYGEVEVRGRISALLELGAGFDPEFSGRDNVYMNGAIMGFSKDEMNNRMSRIESFAEIGSFIDQPVKTYSSGMFIRLAFASAINVDPDVLIIDEALAVGDVYFQQKCFAKIRQFRDQKVTILFVSHDPGAVKNLCQRAYLMDEGSVIKQGKPDEVFDYYNALLASKTQRDVRIIENIKTKQDKSSNKKGEEREQQQDKKQTTKDETQLKGIGKGDFKKKEIGEKKGKKREQEQDDEQTAYKDQHNESHFSYRTGNKKVEIRDCYIMVKGIKTEILTSGSEADICVQAFSHDDISDITVGILIKDRIGNEVFGINTYHLNKTFSVKKGDIIKVTFSGNINIGPGEYTLTVALHSQDVHIHHCYDWIDKYTILNVVPDINYQFIGVARLSMKAHVIFS